MDADGVAAEVLLPNTVPPFFPTPPNITINLPRTRGDFEVDEVQTPLEDTGYLAPAGS